MEKEKFEKIVKDLENRISMWRKEAWQDWFKRNTIKYFS